MHFSQGQHISLQVLDADNADISYFTITVTEQGHYSKQPPQSFSYCPYCWSWSL